MFHVCLRNNTVINVMTVSLTEKDVLYSMAAAGSAENLMPVYQTTRRRIPETVPRITHPLHGGAQDSTFCVLCTFLRSHCCIPSPLFYAPFLRPFALTPHTALRHLFAPSHFRCNALGLVYFNLFDSLFFSSEYRF